jgi:hypothetical protein
VALRLVGLVLNITALVVLLLGAFLMFLLVARMSHLEP